MTEKLYISWEDFHQHAKQLAVKLKENGPWTKIVAVSRGGLLPAGILAYELDIRNVEVVNMSSYDGEKQRSKTDIDIKSFVGEVDEHTIVIDDLSDTGNTFRLLRQEFPNAHFAAVYAKSKGKSFVDFYASEMPDKWIVFPWDL